MQCNVLIIGWIKFPFGSASGSRIRTLAKGLVENGASVRVITTSRIPFRPEDSLPKGQKEWQQIKYESTNLYEIPSKKWTLRERVFNHLTSVYRSWKRTRQLLRKKEYNVVYIYGRSFFQYTPVAIIARLAGIPVFFEICEWFPARKYKGGFLNPFFMDDYLGRQLPSFLGSGVIAITSFIQRKYQKWGVQCLLLPSVFDFSLFKENNEPLVKVQQPDEYFTLVYAGSCKADDGVEALFNALKHVLTEGYQVRLFIVGTEGKKGQAGILRQKAEKDTQLKERVSFLGRVSEDEYHMVLKKAGCLVLPRPDTQITRAAFPTRLPEFLASGRPVLTPNVPDVSLYLSSGVHAEIVDGSGEKSLAKGIIRLLENPERARQIGLAGRERCSEVFDYRVCAKSFYKFIHNVV